MASSDVDIVNLALSHIGDRANVTALVPPDGTVQSEHAARFYAQMRDQLLERFPWKFAKTRATLAERSLVIPSWKHAYAEPNNCVRVLAVLPSGYTADNQGVGFDTEVDSTGQGLVLTNAASATALYISRVTDASRFSPGFVDTLSWVLAAALAGPLIKGETGRQEAVRCMQMAGAAFASATGLSANQAKTRLDFIPSGIASRGGAGEGQFSDVIGDTGGYPIRGS